VGDGSDAEGTASSGAELTNLLRLLGVALCMCSEATSRVAAHLDDVAIAYGVHGARFFVLPTGVFVRLPDGGEVIVDFAPAAGITLRLDQISAVYDLLAEAKAGHSSPDKLAGQVVTILESPPRSSPVTTVVGHMILVVGLGMIIRPTPAGLLCFAALGVLVGVLKLVAEIFSILSLALPVVAALLVTVVAVVLADQLHVPQASRLIIPALVTLLPGTALTIGSMELASGEMIAGTSRLIYGLNVLLLLAFGILLGSHLIGNPAKEPASVALGPWAPWIGVLLVGIGFFMHFSAPAKALPWLLLVLFVVWGAQAVGTKLAGGLAGAFLGGLVVTPAAYFVQSQRGGPPAQVTFLPSFWMLVPGAIGLTGVSELVVSGSSASLNDISQALLTIVAISLGQLVGSSLTQTAAKPSSWLEAPPVLRPVIGARVVTPPTAIVPRSPIKFRPNAAYRRLVKGTSQQHRPLPAFPGADAYLVAFGVGQDPERWCFRGIGHLAASRDGRLNPVGCRVAGHPDVEVDPVALRPRRVLLLEPDRRALPVRVHDGVLRPVVSRFVRVPEHGLPERPDRFDIERVDGDLHQLHSPRCAARARAGRQPLAADRR
jgi:uncharacterized membrane protein YjjP (DUF1212 family)